MCNFFTDKVSTLSKNSYPETGTEVFRGLLRLTPVKPLRISGAALAPAQIRAGTRCPNQCTSARESLCSLDHYATGTRSKKPQRGKQTLQQMKMS